MKIENMDAKEYLKTLKKQSVDLTLTSPPYDNIKNYGDTLDWSEITWKAIIKELYRVTKIGGVVVWIVQDQTIKGGETGTSFKQALFFMESGFILHDTMIFEKTTLNQTMKKRYYSAFEYMFVFSKGIPKTANLQQTEKTGVPNSKSDKSKTHRPLSNVWKINTSGYNKNKHKHDHPAAFPDILAEMHILTWSNAGDVILDCFMGSGTTKLVAEKHGRNVIGCEKNEEYFKKYLSCKI